MKVDWLVIGLGNPGVEYASTRHNIGFRVAQAFAHKHSCSFAQGSGPWLETTVLYARTRFLVALPLTYMNRSGVAATKLLGQTHLPPERLIVIVDEYNFPLGRIHLKCGGSDGGHNGISSLIEHLHTDKFWRLRCGIGKNFGSGELVEYVLSPFQPHELLLVDEMINDAVAALEQIAKAGIARAVSEINARSKHAAQERQHTHPDHGLGGTSGDGSGC